MNPMEIRHLAVLRARAVPWAHRPTPWKSGTWEDSTLLRLRRPTSLTSIEAARFLQALADGDLPAARPRAATVQEGDIAVRALLELGRGTGEGRGKREIIYINLLSIIGNPKYFTSKAPMEKDGRSEFKREIIHTTCRSAGGEQSVER
ncbi:uncharacterized protein LOC119339552 [Triticum dicoccoides]|uniref:uncharacterized protein LOC119339552 n=1 Tax=Triticum dicoccoides TaxID=85692 RepID=UPI0018916BD2|nr:uncharacterized protein LOC119339552 [Triticum dicoccoides]